MAVSSDSLRLGVVEETLSGTTPDTPAFDLFRTVGEGLIFEVTTTNSDEMGGLNRGVKDSILTGATVTGEINFELSKFTALEKLMAAGLGNTWAGDPLTVPGDTADNVYDASDLRTFTIEKTFTVEGGTTTVPETPDPQKHYHRFTGCMVDTMNFSMTPNEPITGSIGFIGEEMTISHDTAVLDDGIITGATYVPAGTNPIMTAPLITGIELLSPAGISDIDGTPLGTPVDWLQESCFTGVDLVYANNGRGLQCLGFLGNKDTVLGRFEVSATGSLYYAAEEPLEALIDQTEFAFRVTCTDDDGESFEFFFPRVKFSAASALASGTNTDVMTEWSMQMLEYTGDTYALTNMITRSGPAVASAPTPKSKPKKEEE